MRVKVEDCLFSWTLVTQDLFCDLQFVLYVNDSLWMCGMIKKFASDTKIDVTVDGVELELQGGIFI